MCLFAASFGGAVFTITTKFGCAKTNDPGSRRGNTMQIVTRWQPSVASNVAQDVLDWAMCSVLQRWIAKAIETSSKGGAFVCHLRFVVVHSLSQTTLLWSIKNKAEPYYCSIQCFNLVCIVWAAAGNYGCPFWPPLLPAPSSITNRGSYK